MTEIIRSGSGYLEVVSGQPNGLATLDGSGILTGSERPVVPTEIPEFMENIEMFLLGDVHIPSIFLRKNFQPSNIMPIFAPEGYSLVSITASDADPTHDAWDLNVYLNGVFNSTYSKPMGDRGKRFDVSGVPSFTFTTNALISAQANPLGGTVTDLLVNFLFKQNF